MKRFVNWLISAYLFPLALSARLALYVKGKILTFDEHYLVTLDIIRRRFPMHTGVVIDIGAFDADSTIFFAKRLRRNTIFGFEPNPKPYELGTKNARRFSNIKLYNLGFSDRIGETDLHVTKNQVSSSLFDLKDSSETSSDRVVKVKIDTLDNFFRTTPEILLLKLDVQGAELSILKAGEETLKKTKLVLTEMLITEIYHGACRYYQVDDFLRSKNFQIHTIITNYNKDGIKYFDILYINLSA